MEITSNHVHFFISYLTAFVVFGLIGKWYLWPAIKDRDPVTALSPLLLYACLRVNGLMFLMPGLVDAELPRVFAVPTAYGDLSAVILALLALWAVRQQLKVAITLVWVFNVVGLLDLVYANVATFTAQVDPADLGAAYYLAVLNVPAMIVVHIVIFLYLRSEPDNDRGTHYAQNTLELLLSGRISDVGRCRSAVVSTPGSAAFPVKCRV